MTNVNHIKLSHSKFAEIIRYLCYAFSHSSNKSGNFYRSFR
ncbi:Uncharacterised protein [Vibrio cholerae]|nr:Uncharacterised protein [Vibrio cholerae]